MLDTFIRTPMQMRAGLPAGVAPEAADYAAHLISRRRAKSTMRQRASCFRTIVTTAVGLDVCPYPMTSAGAISIFAQFAYERRSYSTIAAMRDTVVMMHESGTYPDPTKDRVFRQVWEGIRREVGVGNPNRKIALYRHEVGDMIALALEIGQVQMATMLAVNFEGALRSAELMNLKSRDVIQRDGRVWLTIRQSKTDQASHGAMIELRSVPGASFDAPKMLEAWLERPSPSPDFLFSSTASRTGERSRRAYSRRLKGLASVVGPKYGFLASDVSTHSLRAGYVTTQIDEHGKQCIAETAAHLRHKSLDTLLVYYRPRGTRPNFVANATSGKTR